MRRLLLLACLVLLVGPGCLIFPGRHSPAPGDVPASAARVG